MTNWTKKTGTVKKKTFPPTGRNEGWEKAMAS